MVSLLDGDGIPGMVQRALIAPPATSLSVLADDQRRQVMEESPVKGEYEAAIDRDSAYERLTARASPVQDSAPTPQHRGAWGRVEGAPPPSPRRRPATDTIAEAAVKSVARGLASSLGSALGRQIVRGVLGAILKR